MSNNNTLQVLKNQLEGELFYDDLMKRLYATDASVYRILPLAVAYPKNENDIKTLIEFATEHQTSLIPRTAGTSLAGQCVGEGIVVDVSKYFTKIISLDEANKTVTVQPGVVRDELNNYLKPFGLFFGPNTSTSNRCMIGGMVGNNSSGTTSIKYGVTRDKVLSLKTFLSDGSSVIFDSKTEIEFKKTTSFNTLEGSIYKSLYQSLKSSDVIDAVRKEFPNSSIHRRNTGYALDELIASEVFDENATESFNFCKLLSGSEGTLAFTTEITLQLDDLPPKENVTIALHFDSISSCLKAVKPVMQHDLFMCEMLDKTILDLTKHNKEQKKNRAFIEGNPEAILLCELRSHSNEDLQSQIEKFLIHINEAKLSYAYPVLKGEAITQAFELRKAGLGLLGNMVGDKKAVACIEDTAVELDDLADYIDDFTALMKRHQQKAVYYAHAGAGELHLRPILNLKDKEDVKLFRAITTEVTQLVKKYGGSMSGEHGDGIVRGEFVKMMIGEKNYQLLRQIKSTFDPNNIFNPGKIVDALPMDASLRTDFSEKEVEIDTILDFSASEGILREAEKCNGSGDCRKLPEFGGTMCPSYRATRNEKDTTRARANALREFLTHSEKPNRFNHEELNEVFDLCLSCKACKTECPSSIDVASLKAEFQYQYQKVNGTTLRQRFFANATRYNKIASRMPKFYNSLFENSFASKIIKKFSGIHPQRSLPKVTKAFSSIQAYNEYLDNSLPYKNPVKIVFLYVDEFTNYLESDIAQDAKLLLECLGYNVLPVSHLESGRSYISKGFLEKAKSLANTNISYFKNELSKDVSLVGIEPSAILTFKDEYLRLADDKDAAKEIAKYTFLIEDFIQKEIELGNITSDQFTTEAKTIKFHGHCYQKVLANQKSSFDVLNLPKNYKVTIIPSGCCGMAGSFGYEKEHYDVSMAIGGQTLFPAVRKANDGVLIAANGTSCRHQIKDGTGRLAKHPITILKEALI
ncbi:MAG: FAD-binding and (Fe-S)-binding domain-containing protein [Winogradskyella sp.]